MFVFSKGRPKAVNLLRDHANKAAGRIKTKHGRRDVHGNTKYEKSRLVPEFSKRENWWYCARYSSYGHHPAAFPLPLIIDHIKSWSNAGDTVLDPFMGSGTTGVACLQTERSFIGIELDQHYFDIAKQRIEEASAQLCMTLESG